MRILCNLLPTIVSNVKTERITMGFRLTTCLEGDDVITTKVTTVWYDEFHARFELHL